MTARRLPRVAWIVAGLLAVDTLVRLASCAGVVPERRAHATEAGAEATATALPPSAGTSAPQEATDVVLPPPASRLTASPRPPPAPAAAPPGVPSVDETELRKSLEALQAMGRSMASNEPRECLRFAPKAQAFARAIAHDARVQKYELGIRTARDAQRCVSCAPDAIDACDRFLEAMR